jgi:NAD-dependent deacetylase
MHQDLETVRNWVDNARRIVVLTGAGISTDSGVPDFRGPQGVWTKNPLAEKLSSIRYYMADPEVRKAAWVSRAEQYERNAQPNSGHESIVLLEQTGRLHGLITQNIDGLHQAAGMPPERVIEVHGTMREVICMSCGVREPMGATLERLKAGEDDPPCRDCGGILKSATISFGQNLVPAVIDRAMKVSAECDLFIAIGSTLQVYPVAGTVELAKRSGARVVIINAEPTGMDELADVVFRGAIGEILPRLVLTAKPLGR